ncbi:MAG TPA: sugar phosphate isomerase/epimerase [Pirellulales bacterium]|jgi:sugar phosphate isomerase/epimerase|nr:sugar phosphate isomerase/epimerase [Pirellulales bacterium]
MRFAIAALALSLLAVPAFAADAPDTSGAQKLGWELTLQSWTTHGTVEKSIDYAKQLGLHYIEIYPGQALTKEGGPKWGPEMTDAQIKQMLKIAKAADVKIIDTGVIGISSQEDQARKLFDWAKKLGITEIVSEPEPRALPMIDKLAGEYHIKVAIHDHPKPSRYWDPEYTYDLIKDLKHIGFCADVGHWRRSGLEPAVVLEKYGQKVYSLHFKDLVPDGPNSHGWHDVPWGTGQSKAAEMLRILKEKGFRGPIAIEYEYTWDVPTLQKCVDWFYAEADKLAK